MADSDTNTDNTMSANEAFPASLGIQHGPTPGNPQNLHHYRYTLGMSLEELRGISLHSDVKTLEAYLQSKTVEFE